MTTTEQERTASERVLSYADRGLIEETLHAAALAADDEVAALDRQIDALWVPTEDDPTVTDLPDASTAEHDRLVGVMEAAEKRATRLYELGNRFEDAKIVSFDAPMVPGDVIAAVTAALVTGWQQGWDVGEIVAEGVAEAQRVVHTAVDGWLTDNRPGSWEASYVQQIMDSAGWDR